MEKGKKLREFPWSACDDSVIATLLDWIARGRSLDIQDEENKTLLHTYTSLGRTKIVSFLLDNGASTKIKDVEGMTALHYTSTNLSTDLLNRFIAKGVDLDVKDNIGWTPLHHACIFNMVEHIGILLENGASPGVKNNKGETPFHLAVRACGVDVLRIFVSKEVKINDRDNKGKTAFHHAFRNGNGQNIKFLLEKGMDIDAQDFQGWTPLMYEIQFNKFDSVKFLIKMGAFIDFKAHNGDTPLHVAAKCPAFKDVKCNILTYLLEQGAMVGVRNKRNHTAYGELNAGINHIRPYFIRHILKMKVLQPVDEEIAEDRTLKEEYVALLQEEIEQIKSTEISEGFVLYEVIAQRENPRYLLNKNLVHHLEVFFESDNCLRKFPSYGMILKSQFRRSQRRHYLRDRTLDCILQNLEHNWCFVQTFPPVVWNKVFSYLGEADMYNFFKAVNKGYI